MTPNEIVAANIVRLRRDTDRWNGQELTRTKLAHACGWSDSKLLDIEHGRDRRPGATPDELYVLARALEVTIYDLLVPPPGVEFVESDGPDGAAPYTVWSVDKYTWTIFGMPRDMFDTSALSTLRDTALSATLRRRVLAYHPGILLALACAGQVFLSQPSQTRANRDAGAPRGGG